MVSTFHGLEVAKRGMTTQQNALYVTGNNISNASTPGYSRQRVNFEQTEAFPAPGMNRPQIPGQMGTGVKAGSIERIREGFLDVQYRGESNKLGYWQSRSDSLQKMEEIMNEPSDAGISAVMDQFWQSLQDLSVNPGNSGARSVVRQRGIAVAETFNYVSNSLKSVQSDLKHETDVTVTSINSLLSQINQLNQNIAQVEPHGMLPNDLYDQRDLLVDQLSSLVPINVKTEPVGGLPATRPDGSSMALGKYTIELVTPSGNVTLVDGTANSANELQVNEDNTTKLAASITIGVRDQATNTVTGTAVNVSQFSSTGKLRSLIDASGYMDGSTKKGIYPEMLDKLDQMAFSFATEFNKQHLEGYDVDGIKANPPVKTTNSFFDIGTTAADAASSIKIDSSIMTSLDNIAAASTPSLGDGSNAVLLAKVKNTEGSIPGQSGTIQSYYEGMIGGMAVQSQEAQRMTANSEVLQQSVDERRQSVSSVSLDEEMTNMIKFQQAYNASARMINIVDEMLDKIINGMGTGGR